MASGLSRRGLLAFLASLPVVGRFVGDWVHRAPEPVNTAHVAGPEAVVVRVPARMVWHRDDHEGLPLGVWRVVSEERDRDGKPTGMVAIERIEERSDIRCVFDPLDTSARDPGWTIA